MPAKLLDGEALAEKIQSELKKETAALKAKGVVPSLAAIQVGENAASAVYIRNQKKSCEAIGLAYTLHELPGTSKEAEVVDYVRKLNEDRTIHGIILQMPLPEGIDPKGVQMAIAPDKDVEGMHSVNIGRLVYGKAVVAPCTALGALELALSSGVDLKGKEVVIINHSEIIGKPLALMLLTSLSESATPTVCHVATRDLTADTRRADIIFSAVPNRRDFLKADMIKEGAIVIDIATIRVPVLDEQGKPVLNQKGKKKMTTVGNCAKDISEKASYLSPVPGGVGPLTVTMLLKNTVTCAKTLSNQA